MDHLPYIAPTTRILSVRYESLLCQIFASTAPYKDNGDYDWDTDD